MRGRRSGPLLPAVCLHGGPRGGEGGVHEVREGLPKGRNRRPALYEMLRGRRLRQPRSRLHARGSAAEGGLVAAEEYVEEGVPVQIEGRVQSGRHQCLGEAQRHRRRGLRAVLPRPNVQRVQRRHERAPRRLRTVRRRNAVAHGRGPRRRLGRPRAALLRRGNVVRPPGARRGGAQGADRDGDHLLQGQVR